MKVEDVKKIAVMGAGDMGHGIAEVALLAGYKVAMRDIEQRFVDKGLARIKESLDKLVEKQKVTADNQKAMLANIKTFVDIGESVKDDRNGHVGPFAFSASRTAVPLLKARSAAPQAPHSFRLTAGEPPALKRRTPQASPPVSLRSRSPSRAMPAPPQIRQSPPSKSSGK